MPSIVAVATTRRQLSMPASMASRKYGARIKLGTRIGVERVLDAVEELRTDDAATAPDRRQVGRLEVPVVLGAAGSDLIEALRVRHDLRRVQRGLDVGGELLGVSRLVAERAGSQTLRLSCGALIAATGQCASKYGLGDAGDRHAQIQSRLDRPAARSLLLGSVDDDVDQRLARLGVDLAEHLGGDLDQVGLEGALVPLGEDVGNLTGVVARASRKRLYASPMSCMSAYSMPLCTILTK